MRSFCVQQEVPLPSLPSFPVQPNPGYVLFAPAQWHWIGQALQVIYSALEVTMSTVDDLNAQLDAIKASESAEADSLASLGTALGTIISDLQNLPPVGVLTQDQLDAVVQKATDDATAAAQNAATGASQSAQATGAVPPTV